MSPFLLSPFRLVAVMTCIHSNPIGRCSQWTQTVRVGLALQCECASGRVGYGSDAASAHVDLFLSTPLKCNAANHARRIHDTVQCGVKVYAD